MIKTLLKTCGCLAAVWLAFAASATAGPYSLTYSGRLVSGSGNPIAGPVDLELRFFHAATLGPSLLPSAMPYTDLVLINGVFSITLDLTAAEYDIVFDGTNETWIEVKDVTHNRTYPRQRFAAVPYALKVPVDPNTLTYNADGQLMLKASPLANKYLKSDGAGGILWVDLSPGTGDMVTADYDAIAPGDGKVDAAVAADTAANATQLNGQAASYYTNAANIPETATRKWLSDTERTKLGGIEALADVTDATNVAAAGAVMDGDFGSDGLMKRSGAGNYTIVADASGNWTTAYDDRMKWDGGSTGLNVANAKSSLAYGTMADQNANAVNITGGTIAGATLTGFTSTGIDDNADALAMTIDSAERVGIGTPTPTAKLDVVSATSGTGRFVYTGAVTQTTAAIAAKGGIQIDGGQPDTGSTIFLKGNVADGQPSQIYTGYYGATEPALILGTYANRANQLYLDPSGDVGIGTTTPGTKLHVVDADLTAGSKWPATLGESTEGAFLSFGYYADGTNVTKARIKSHGGDPLTLGTSSRLETITLLDSGNVGIGTATPGAALEVVGQVKVTSGIVDVRAAPQNLSFPAIGTGRAGLHLAPDSSTAGYSNAITFGANNSANLTHANAGIYVESGSGFGTRMHFATSDDFSAGSKARLTVLETGNVGIGTTTPKAKLQIGQSLNPGSGIGPKVLISNDVASDDIATVIPALGLTTYGDVSSTGKRVRLGFYHPQGGLGPLTDVLAATMDAVLEPTTQTWGEKAAITFNTQTAAASHGAGLTERLRIASDGSVGVGVTNPTAKLHVGGTAGVDGIKFPDGTLQTTAASGSAQLCYCVRLYCHDGGNAGVERCATFGNYTALATSSAPNCAGSGKGEAMAFRLYTCP